MRGAVVAQPDDDDEFPPYQHGSEGFDAE